MMKLPIATGLGLVLFVATMIGGPLGVRQAQAQVTLADLAGKFSLRGSGFFTGCFTPGSGPQNCATATNLAPNNITAISTFTRDEAGKSCGSSISAIAPVSGTRFPANVVTGVHGVGTTTSFDPTTGSGTVSISLYAGGSCNRAVFDSTGATLEVTETFSFDVSDSGNRIEMILTSFNTLDSPFSVAGSTQGWVFSDTAIRQ